MKIYEIHFDNGEPYEDNYHDSEAFFLTKNGAEKYITEKIGAVKKKNQEVYILPEYRCSRGKTNCDGCPDYWDNDNYNGKIFFDKETGGTTDVCPESYCIMDSDLDYSFWTIRECEVIEE